jgi:hypothetical protein
MASQTHKNPFSWTPQTIASPDHDHLVKQNARSDSGQSSPLHFIPSLFIRVVGPDHAYPKSLPAKPMAMLEESQPIIMLAQPMASQAFDQ